MSMSNSEARKRAAEKAVEALKAEVALEVAADYDAEIERLTEARDKCSEMAVAALIDAHKQREALIAVAGVLDDYSPDPRTNLAAAVCGRIRRILLDLAEAS